MKNLCMMKPSTNRGRQEYPNGDQWENDDWGRSGNASIQGMDVVLDAAGTFSMGGAIEPSGEAGKPVEEIQVKGAGIMDMSFQGTNKIIY